MITLSGESIAVRLNNIKSHKRTKTMKKDLVNVSGHDFTKLGDKLEMNSIAWNFWNFVKGTGSTEEEAADNLEVVGDALKDKFGEVFALHELEAWLANQENKPEDIIKALELEISESDDADEEDEDDEDDEDLEEDDDSDNIDGCGAPEKNSKKKGIKESFYYSEDEDDDDWK